MERRSTAGTTAQIQRVGAAHLSDVLDHRF